MRIEGVELGQGDRIVIPPWAAPKPGDGIYRVVKRFLGWDATPDLAQATWEWPTRNVGKNAYRVGVSYVFGGKRWRLVSRESAV